MRHLQLLLLAGVLLLAACAGQADIVQYQQGDGQVRKIDLGYISAMAVEDLAGSMDISLFKGPLEPAELDRYFNSEGKAPSSVNVFLLHIEEKLLLVDTGWGPDGRNKGNALAELGKLGVTPDKIDFVLLTHMHGDHISGLINKDGKAAFPKAQVLVSKPEADFWLAVSTLKGDYKGGAELSRKVAAAYKGRFNTFSFGSTVFPGVLAMEAVGHTPGHTAFMVEGRDWSLLIAGDFLHAAALQFAHPEEYPRYDMDPQTAVKTRRALLDLAAEEGLIVAGMHIPFSGMGKVQKDGNGYKFVPLATK